MKKSLVTGVSALLLGLMVTGCTPTNLPSVPDSQNSNTSTETVGPDSSTTTTPDAQAAEVTTVAAINALGTDGNSAKHGKLVRVENVEVYAAYKNFMFVHQILNVEGTLYTEIALEVHSKQDLSKLITSTVVTLEGTVDMLDGHIIVKDAEVTIVKKNPTGEIKHLALLPQNFDRVLANYDLTMQFNGLGAISELQLVEDLGTITEAGKTVKVVFPGEDITETDPAKNKYIMNYIIPAGLSAKELKFLNEVRFKDLKAGDCFESIIAVQYINTPEVLNWNVLYVPYIGGNPDYIGGRVRKPIIYKDFATMKSEYLVNYINEGDEAIFPNLALSEEAYTNKDLFAYLPDDMGFTEEKGYTLTFTLNGYDLKTSLETILANLEAQHYFGDYEGTQTEIDYLKTYTLTSDNTANPKFSVVIENLLDELVYVSVSFSNPKPEVMHFESADFDVIYNHLNESVDKASRRYNVLLPQVEFKSKIFDIRDIMKKYSFNATDIELTRKLEDAYIQPNGALPIMLERLYFNFDSDLTPIDVKLNAEGKIEDFDYPDEIVDNFLRVNRDVKVELLSRGFEFVENTLLYQEGPNGEHLPVYCYYNKETSESIRLDIIAPKHEAKQNEAGEWVVTWDKEWSVVLTDEIIHGGIQDRMEPRPEDQPMINWPGELGQKLFQQIVGTTAEFIVPDFATWEILIATEKDHEDHFVLMAVPDCDDPIKVYKAQLEAAGYTVTTKTMNIPADPETGAPATTQTKYIAVNAETGLTYEFVYVAENNIMQIVVFKTPAPKAN